MTTSSPNSSTIKTERLLSASPSQIFAAFAQPELLAQWWGPDGFTNTFHTFEFIPGGHWNLTMHGPDGKHYPNESVFKTIEPETKIVLEHLSPPWFIFTLILTPQGAKTHITWRQEFASPQMANQLYPICQPANEQNINRLEKVLAQIKT